MEKNISTFDKIIRIAVACFIAPFSLLENAPPQMVFLSCLVALGLLFTARQSYCPVYKAFGIKTYLNLNARIEHLFKGSDQFRDPQ